MENNELRHIVEDHALIDDFLTQISRCLTDGLPMPSHIPQLHDGLMTDILSNIVGKITLMRAVLQK